MNIQNTVGEEKCGNNSSEYIFGLNGAVPHVDPLALLNSVHLHFYSPSSVTALLALHALNTEFNLHRQAATSASTWLSPTCRILWHDFSHNNHLENMASFRRWDQKHTESQYQDYEINECSRCVVIETLSSERILLFISHRHFSLFCSKGVEVSIGIFRSNVPLLFRSCCNSEYKTNTHLVINVHVCLCVIKWGAMFTYKLGKAS